MKLIVKLIKSIFCGILSSFGITLLLCIVGKTIGMILGSIIIGEFTFSEFFCLHVWQLWFFVIIFVINSILLSICFFISYDD